MGELRPKRMRLRAQNPGIRNLCRILLATGALGRRHDDASGTVDQGISLVRKDESCFSQLSLQQSQPRLAHVDSNRAHRCIGATSDENSARIMSTKPQKLYGQISNPRAHVGRALDQLGDGHVGGSELLVKRLGPKLGDSSDNAG